MWFNIAAVAAALAVVKAAAVDVVKPAVTVFAAAAAVVSAPHDCSFSSEALLKSNPEKLNADFSDIQPKNDGIFSNWKKNYIE